jgi:hypothetical protein
MTRLVDDEIAADAGVMLYDCLQAMSAPTPDMRKLRNTLFDAMLALSRANVPMPIDIGKARRKEQPGGPGK